MIEAEGPQKGLGGLEGLEGLGRLGWFSPDRKTKPPPLYLSLSLSLYICLLLLLLLLLILEHESGDWAHQEGPQENRRGLTI